MRHLRVYETFLAENVVSLETLPKFLTRELTRGVKDELSRLPPKDIDRIAEIANEINDIIADKGMGISWGDLMKSSAKMQSAWHHPVYYFEEILKSLQERNQRTSPGWDVTQS